MWTHYFCVSLMNVGYDKKKILETSNKVLKYIN